MDAPAGSQHPEALAEHGVLVRGQADDAVGDDDVVGIAGQRHGLYLSLDELDVGEAEVVPVLAGQFQHGRRHVQAGNAPGIPHLLRRQEAVNAAAGTEVQHPLTGPESGQGRGVAAAGGRRDGLGGQASQLTVVVQAHGVVEVRRAAAGGSGLAAATAGVFVGSLFHGRAEFDHPLRSRSVALPDQFLDVVLIDSHWFASLACLVFMFGIAIHAI